VAHGEVRQYTISIPGEVLDDLRRRLAGRCTALINQCPGQAEGAGFQVFRR